MKRVDGTEWRERWPNHTYASVDDKRVSIEALSVRSINFGQHWRTSNIVDVRYSLEIPISFFAAFLDEPDQFPALVEDTQRFPDPADSLDRALRDAGFPSASDALLNPQLAEQLATFFAHEVLLRWIGDGGPQIHPGYVLNTTDRVEVNSTTLIIAGTARPAGLDVLFQDV